MVEAGGFKKNQVGNGRKGKGGTQVVILNHEGKLDMIEKVPIGLRHGK